jgi:DNA-binding transcriptional MerR regulator
MADYYAPAQLAVKLGISESQIAELESKGFLHPKLKDGRRFYSSHQAYELHLALRLARKQKLTLEKAIARVEVLRLSSVSTTGS